MQLVVTEKPAVARVIAEVLGATEKKNGYLEGNNWLVTWCYGHLVEPVYPEAYDERFSKWVYETLPIIPTNWQYQIKEETREQFEIIKSLMWDDRVTSIVEATDCAREGELIFRLVYQMAECDKPFTRLWINSLEESAIRKGFEDLIPGDFLNNLYLSARCRQCADWLVGLNATRLFTVLYQGKTLKVGRVQTPTLAMVVDREMQIRNFKKTPYYTIQMPLGSYTACTDKYEMKEKAEQDMILCSGKTATVTEVKREEKSIAPPKLYDLTSLQRDANRIFGFTAKKTLDLTQSLYEKKLVTYPRTDCNYLSDEMGATTEGVIKAVLEHLAFSPAETFQPEVKRVLNSKKLTDHHAIIPTVQIEKTDIAKLPEDEQKIMNLIACRLLAATAEKYRYESMTAEVKCENIVFHVKAKKVVDLGWKAFEEQMRGGYAIEPEKEETEDGAMQTVLEDLQECYAEVKPEIVERYTKAPARFTEATLLTAMEHAGADEISEEAERKGLGTTATRADIIEKLIKDGFLVRDKKTLLPTEDGEKLITILPDSVKSPHMTAEWENDLVLVSKGEKTAYMFMRSIEDMVRELVATYHSISEEEKDLFRVEQEVLGHCPHCGKDVVTGKYGAYCSGKCGLGIQRAYGHTLTPMQIKEVLDGKKIFVKGLKNKAGKSYDAYLIPDGVEEYSYSKDGSEKSGWNIKYRMEFPEHNNKRGRR
ncbi:MAG: DNA topoisomerase 3 [Lachnospiraceae bacterium]|nr:DNA topoisomerase 3 [Lachnospiraceae bacterium]